MVIKSDEAMKSTDDELQDSDSLNTTILEYYNKFGKDRRLKKYLRFKKPGDAPVGSNKCLVDIPKLLANQNVSVQSEENSSSEEPPHIEAKKQAKELEHVDVPNSSDNESDAEILASETSDIASRKGKTSNKRLEWDSLGDVGYKNQPMAEKLKTPVEKLDCNIFKLFDGSEKPGEERKSTISSLNLSKQKENWRRTLENVKKKYDNQLLDTSDASRPSLRFNSVSFSALSTPATSTNKSVQTSKVDVECKQVQVSLRKTKSPIESSSRLSSSKSDSSSISIKNKITSNNKGDVKNSENSTDASVSTTGSSRKVQPDLELGINLLCLLIESKNLSARKKEKLVRKIVSRISGKRTSSSSESVLTSANKLASASASSNTGHVDTPQYMQQGLDERLATLLENMNQQRSENKENNKSTISSNEKEDLSSNEYADSILKSDLKKKDENKREHRRFVRSRSADDTHFMRSWLDPMTKSEFNYQNSKYPPKSSDKKESIQFVPKPSIPTAVNKSQLVVIDPKAGGDFVPTGCRRSSEVLEFITNERISHLNWIESEIKHLDNLKELLLKTKTNFIPTNRNQLAYGAAIQNVYDKVASSSNGRSSFSTSRSLPVLYEKDILSEKEMLNANQLYKRLEVRHEHEIFCDSSSQERLGHNQTPTYLKNTAVEIKEEKKFPKRNYIHSEKHAEKQLRSKLETPPVVDNIEDYVHRRKQQFMDRCEKIHSSKLEIDNSEENGHYSEPCEKSRSKPENSESDACSSTTSPNFFISSGSISIPEVTTSTTTTTHQYDNRIGVGVQTTESLLDTGKIVEIQNKVKRPYRCSRNKQTQTKPQSIAYVISFETKRDAGESNEVTLREYLQRRRPDFTKRIDQRCDVLDKLRSLRRERDKHMREIVENYSITSIPKKLKELPPPPTKYLRIFTTKEMKKMTKKKYSQLPEVLERNKKLRIDKYKRSNRIITEVFNKRIQQRVRKGKLNLEQSMTVI